ncbi:hypothetical protein LIER_05597 [Lithospermum erythrorhizon]|uniref:Reverse transcriptase RNase H-like domain-containing protein n=1 Tax=Lithospermum erythrorhizon TaxID=34254 RepID=A0AAV3P606_LITER
MEPPTSYKEVQRMREGLHGVERVFVVPETVNKAGGSRRTTIIPVYIRGAVSSVLVREEEGSQRPIYFVSYVLHGAEEPYPLIDKFVFAVVITERKLNAYFEAHPIKVMTDQPIKRIMSNPSMTGRLTTCAIERSEFEVSYVPRSSVKAQALEDFVVE